MTLVTLAVDIIQSLCFLYLIKRYWKLDSEDSKKDKTIELLSNKYIEKFREVEKLKKELWKHKGVCEYWDMK